jgi:ATP-dependent RNA helicase DeaD
MVFARVCAFASTMTRVASIAAQRMIMTTFEEFGLPAKLMTALEQMEYKSPTPIQVQAIPLAMQGKDILGSAATGTGKTGAFSIPMIAKVMDSPRGGALVLTPTRELAAQVMEVIKGLLGKRSFIPTALLIGGDSMSKQCAMLRMRPRIIVGTPGRINDHLERGNLILHDVNYLVLDETDRMLDMGFGVQIERIVKFLPPVRQTLMFSATLPDGIVKMSSRYLKNPERIAVDTNSKPHVNIKQEVIEIAHAAKFDELVNQIKTREGSIIVFVKTKRGADRMAERLDKMHLKADTIHGDLHQRKREKVIQSFRDRKFRVLVATDIAARGLDIPHIEHVINFDLPQCPEDYIHRIGRTARNGAEGSAICFVSPDDRMLWRDIQRLLNPGEKLPPLPPRQNHSNGNRSGAKRQGRPGGPSRNGDKPYRPSPKKPEGEKRASEGGRQERSEHNKGKGLNDQRRRRRPDNRQRGDQSSAPKQRAFA